MRNLCPTRNWRFARTLSTINSKSVRIILFTVCPVRAKTMKCESRFSATDRMVSKQSLKLFSPIQLAREMFKCIHICFLISQFTEKAFRFSRKIIIYAPAHFNLNLQINELKRNEIKSNKKIKIHWIYYDVDRLMNRSDLMHVFFSLLLLLRCLNDLQNETQIKSLISKCNMIPL